MKHNDDQAMKADHADMRHDHEHMDHGDMQMDHDQHDMKHADHADKHHDHEHMDHGDMQMDHGSMDHMNMDHGSMDHGGGMHMHMDMGDMKRRFWICLALTAIIVVLSPMMGMTLPFTVTGIPGQKWLVTALGTVLFFYGGKPFFQGAKQELQQKQPAMMTLVTMGISVAYFYSIYSVVMTTLHPQMHIMDFFWEMASLIVIMLFGHILEMKTIMQAGSAVDALARLVPDQAHVKTSSGAYTDKAVSQVNVGDTLMVKENERVPLDGVVLQGTSSLDESLLTGESAGVTKHPDDDVVGGSQNQNTSFTMKVTKGSGEGFLSQVQAMVSKAQGQKSRSETLANRVAGWLFYAAVGTAAVALVVWWALRGFNYALPIVVTVLVVACPHALGLAIPLVIARMTSIGADHDLLIQNREALEQIKTVKYVLMDKTGTLTEGQFKVQGISVSADDWTEKQVLAVAAGLETGSTHPLARGILQRAERDSVDAAHVENFKNIPGTGVAGDVDGTHYALVNRQAVMDDQLDYDHTQYQTYADAGYSVSFLVVAHQTVVAMIAEGDAVKQDAPALIKRLKQLGMTPVMLTGDNAHAAKHVADELDIQAVHAELKPDDKVTFVKKYQEKAGAIMVGDGVNDSPALAEATIGVAIGAGTQVAIAASDVVLVDSKPSDIVALIELARNSRRKMIENLWWGAGYNLIALPLAAGILIPFGFRLTPMMGAILMSLSTIIVAINAMTLKIDD